MRADIASPLHPSLPSGNAVTPAVMGGDAPALTPPSSLQRAARRARKQQQLAGGGSLRMRRDHVSMGSPPSSAVLTSGSPGGSSPSPGGSLLMQEHRYAPVGLVTEPQTIQEKRELLEYFQKLQVLVPSLPKTGKIPKLDIIEHVISYIKKLESDLIDHPMIQVLENSAYVSCLLQSMAPEFDISHLFPARDRVSSNTTTAAAAPTTTTAQLDQSDYFTSSRISTRFQQHSTLRSLHKNGRSSHRKPLGILASSSTHN